MICWMSGEPGDEVGERAEKVTKQARGYRKMIC